MAFSNWRCQQFCSIDWLARSGWLVICAGVIGALPSLGRSEQPIPNSPVEAAETLDLFQLPPGLRIELVASEPQVIDPVAIRFDELGRMWVVEMRDYPNGPEEGQPPRSRINVLEDRDGDGRFETVTVFADKLMFPTGVQPWKGGVFVTMAGQVAYMKDTDGDGRADLVEPWYTGFAQENPQLRANHPRLALDHHIYIANGLRGGQVVDARTPDQPPLSISGMDFRFDPLTRRFEAASGIGQFGLTFDDWGNRFVCSNRNPLKHIVLENWYLQRNPLAAVSSVFHDVAKAGFDSRVYPITRSWTTSNLHAGQFTAACGVEVYRGDALPEAYYGNAFICEPTAHLVHREVMRPLGATFTSRPGRKGIDFLAGRDPWFSPVNLRTGPDGALYVVDMYRAVIEHPQFMPVELKNRPDLRDGDDRGRIYRVVAADAPRTRFEPLAGMSSKQLAERLASRNAWQRETAARLLLERNDRSVERQLKQLATGGRPATRVQALWLLDGLQLLDEPTVRRALADPHPGVRRQAVVLAERWLATSPSLRQQVRGLSGDSDPQVRFQVALSLAPARSEEDYQAVCRIADRGIHDQWTRHAVAVAAGPWAGPLAVRLLQQDRWQRELPDSDHVAMITELLSAVGADPDQQRQLQTLAGLCGPLPAKAKAARSAGLAALARSLAKQRRSLRLLARKLDPQQGGKRFEQVLQGTADLALDGQRPDAERIEAIQLLGVAGTADEVLARLALEEPRQQVRLAAIAALARRPPLEPWRQLLADFRIESPQVRRAILDGLLARVDRTTLLLDQIEAGRFKASELDRNRLPRLLKHRDPAIRRRANTLLAASIPEDRQKVLADYQRVLKMKGDPYRGREVFKKNCASCHRIGDIGVQVAPDISDSRVKTPQQILTDILQPNRAIDANYIGYTIITMDGRVLTGILSSETSTSVTLRQQEGKEVTLLRSEIDELQSTGLSLMPVGLEKDVPPQDMADVIAFIKNWRYLDGMTPLARPSDTVSGR